MERSTKVNLFSDIIKTIRDILINDISDPENLTLKDFCDNRVVQDFNLTDLKNPIVTIFLEEEDRLNNFAKTYRLLTRGWVKITNGMLTAGTEKFNYKTYATKMDERIKELIENESNILGDKCVINKIEGISGSIEEKVDQYKAFSKLSIYRLIVINKKN